MADDTRVIRIVVDASMAVDGSAAATRAFERMERSQRSATAALTGLETQLRGFVGSWLGMQGVRAVLDAADAFTRFTNSLKVAGIEGQALTGVQNRLFAAANKHGVEIGALGQLYGRIAMTSRELGASQSDMLKFVDGVTAALRVQGGSTEQASGALLQLSQALGAGTVRAEEFNSILEGAQPIAQAAARGIDGMGGSVAKLRAAVVDGKVSSQQFFEGLLRGFQQTEVQASKSSLTISGALTSLNNNWSKFVGGIDQAVGGSKLLVSGVDALSSALERLSGIAANGNILTLLSALSNPGGFLGITAVTKSPVATLGDEIEKKRTELNKAREFLDGLDPNNRRRPLYEREVARFEAQLSGLERQQNVLAVGGKVTSYADDPDNIGILPNPPPRAPVVDKKAQQAAESAADKYAKLTAELRLSAEAQAAMTAAARDGDVAFEKQKATLDAQQKMLDIYGTKLGFTREQLAAVRDRLLEIAQGKAAEAFNVATTELEKQNTLLEAEIALVGQLPEIRAAELALIKSEQEAEKAGSALTAEDVERRRQAIEANERLKVQAEELKRAQELWTEPLKQALRDIQQVGADAFMQMLDSGKFSFEELGKTFSTIIKRMIAEFLALATIRPVMSVVVNAISPQIAQQMGMSSGGSTGGGIGSIGGGSLFGGGSGGWLGGVGDWLKSPISGALPSTQYGPPAPGQSFSGGWLDDITWGQGLGAAAGIGMGAYQLLSGNGSTASTIGGIASMVGGAVSLIPGVGQIAGPIISILGSVLPSLFGESKPTITDQAYGQLAYGGGGYFTTGGAWGPNADASSLTGPLGQTGATMQAIYDALGGVQDPSRVWGLALQSMSQQYGDGSSFANQTSFVVGPNGQRRQWGMGSNAGDVGTSTAAANAVINSIMEGAVGAISDNLRDAIASLGTAVAPTLDTVAQLVNDIIAFDAATADFGKTVSDATSATRDALDQIDASFQSLFDTAAKYGLDTAGITAEQARQRLAYGQDFADSLTRGILGINDPTAAALFDLDKARQEAVDTNAVLLTRVEGYQDQILRIEEYYGLQRTKVVEEAGKAATDAAVRSVESLQDLIKRLQYGDLSTASPELMLSGTSASYAAALAQARAGDATAAANLPGLVESYVAAGKDYYGSSGGFQAINQQIQRDIVGLIPQVASAGGGASNQQINVLMQGFAQMQQMFADAQRENAQLRQQVAELTAAIKRAA